jgi:hypothetical protein
VIRNHLAHIGLTLVGIMPTINLYSKRRSLAEPTDPPGLYGASALELYRVR